MSIHDKLDQVDGNDEVEDILDVVSDVKDEASAIDDEVKDLSKELDDFKAEWKVQQFDQLQEFIDGRMNDFIEQLDAIAKRLY